VHCFPTCGKNESLKCKRCEVIQTVVFWPVTPCSLGYTRFNWICCLQHQDGNEEGENMIRSCGWWLKTLSGPLWGFCLLCPPPQPWMWLAIFHLTCLHNLTTPSSFSLRTWRRSQHVPIKLHGEKLRRLQSEKPAPCKPQTYPKSRL
jgi:hypothetical protein